MTATVIALWLFFSVTEGGMETGEGSSVLIVFEATRAPSDLI